MDRALSVPGIQRGGPPPLDLGEQESEFMSSLVLLAGLLGAGLALCSGALNLGFPVAGRGLLDFLLGRE